MRGHLSQDQIVDLLEYIGVDKIGNWKGEKISFCCPIHGERHPSCGINADFHPDDDDGDGSGYQVFNCFSCGESGSLAWFLYKSLPEEFGSCAEAARFINDRYSVAIDFLTIDKDLHVDRYEELYEKKQVDKRFVVPRARLAIYASGEETYQYFFDRGYTRKDMQKWMIGRDLENETITIPSFWEDGQLAGIIGRYIDPSRPKNSRFKIYEFPKASMIYPLDKLVVDKGVIIGVESMLDVILLHKWGFPNSVATMGGGMSKTQANMIAERCHTFIAMFDADDGGALATKKAKKLLNGRVRFLTPSYHPEKTETNAMKDPGDWGEVETVRVIKSAGLATGIPRL
jgi:DNA primase